MHIPTYQDVLDSAATWRDRDTHEDLEKAEKILRQGLNDHAYALPIGDELALVLQRQGRDAEAFELLNNLGSRYRDAGEETLCRFGKIFKKRAERVAMGNPAAAIREFEESEHYYELAYEKSFAFYPRINQLTVCFLRAACAKRVDKVADTERLLLKVREQAEEMLRTPSIWQMKRDDDSIWIPATQGEVNLLLGHWAEAEQAYEEAMRQAAGKKFYLDCMCVQVEMLLEACQHLNIHPEGPLAGPKTFFST